MPRPSDLLQQIESHIAVSLLLTSRYRFSAAIIAVRPDGMTST
jgi:hypothetical protein